MLLSKTFLEGKARDLGLTAEQEEVFILKFGEQKSNYDIATRLGISPNACVQCLGEIYKKVGIVGRSRGKANRLQSELLREAEQRQAAAEGSPAGRLVAPAPLESPQDRLLEQSFEPDASERQYLKQWLNRIQEHEKTLGTEKGWDEVDSVLKEFSKHLPQSANALAADSALDKVQVVQHLLQSVGKLFATINPSLNTIEGLRFLTTENAVHRSISALVSRLMQQLNLPEAAPELTSQSIINDVIEQGQRVFGSSLRQLPHPRLKTYSAWARKACLEALIKRAFNFEKDDFWDQSFFAKKQILRMDTKEDIARNLRAIDTAILEMYLNAKNPDEINFNFFDVLLARWMKAVPWGNASLLPKKATRFPQNDESITTASLDAETFEWAALNSLRREYHNLDEKSYLELHDYFLRRVEPVKEKYLSRFWTGYDDADYATAQYTIVSIPASLGQPDNATGAAIARSVWRYCELAAYNILTLDNLKELDSLLQQAQQHPILDFWFNEIDHFTAHCIEHADAFPILSGLS
ncbi:MAG: hypothetical protein ACFCVD_07830 [Nodosilinea sp.]